MQVTILGIRKSKNKDKTRDYFNYYVSRPFSDYEAGANDPDVHAQGVFCGAEFSTVELNCKVGDVVELHYQPGFQGKAVISGCSVIKPASK
ncbi:MAG: hypothetical protein IKS07_02310 [Lachnospiraceae bacterium]|nr:hypothetical protein [Lachnospiraceae bacterium]